MLGIVCGLISGLCYASHFPFYVWWQPRYSTATLYAYMLLGGALALLPFVDFAPTRSWTAWANLLALGVVTNYGAYLAYGRSLQLISQVKAAIIGNIEPVLATFWVWVGGQRAGHLGGIPADGGSKLIRLSHVTAHGMFFGHAVFFASSRNTFSQKYIYDFNAI